MPASAPRFSVVVPTYNRPDLLRQTIDSVLSQRFTDFELIVVDDGSTDDTPQLLQAYGDRLLAVRQGNAGQGVARNRGVEASRGQYLAFLDSDDFWLPWTLEAFDAALRNDGDPALLVGTRQYFVEETEALSITEASLEATPFADFFTMQRHHYTPAGSGTLVVCREDFLRVEGFDNVRCNSEDVDLYLRLGDAAGCLRLESPITLACRHHEGNSSNDLRRSIEGLDYLIRREREGVYPGGSGRWLDRWAVLTFHVRNMSLRLASAGNLLGAMRYYAISMRAHVRLSRWRYLAAAPLLCLYRRLVAGFGAGRNHS